MDQVLGAKRWPEQNQRCGSPRIEVDYQTQGPSGHSGDDGAREQGKTVLPLDRVWPKCWAGNGALRGAGGEEQGSTPAQRVSKLEQEDGSSQGRLSTWVRNGSGAASQCAENVTGDIEQAKLHGASVQKSVCQACTPVQGTSRRNAFLAEETKKRAIKSWEEKLNLNGFTGCSGQPRNEESAFCAKRSPG